MSMVNVFKSRPQTIGYVFKSGKTVHFVNHQYTTTAPDEIKELSDECKANGAYFYVEGDGMMDTATLDPIAGLRAQIEAEVLAKYAAQGNPLRDMGTTPMELKVGGIANSQTINGLAAATEVQAIQARVVVPGNVTPGVQVTPAVKK